MAPHFTAAGDFLSGCDGKLGCHKVDSGDLFGDGVLNLQARVNFKEVQLALVTEQVFACAQTDVVNGVEEGLGVSQQERFSLSSNEGCGGLFDEFLVAALHRAVTGGIDGEGAVGVAPALGFQVAGLGDVAFNEEARARDAG